MKKLIGIIAVFMVASLAYVNSVYAAPVHTVDNSFSKAIERPVPVPSFEADIVSIISEVNDDNSSEEVVTEEISEEDYEDASTVEGFLLPEIPAYSAEDVELLAKLIWHESEGEPRDGKIAVGEVVLNRINSELYPDTVYDVIYQEGQFSHVRYVEYETPDVETIRIADDVLNHGLKVLNNDLVLYFRNPMKTSKIPASEEKNWGIHKYATYYGNHAFYIHTFKQYTAEELSSMKKTKTSKTKSSENEENADNEELTEELTEEEKLMLEAIALQNMIDLEQAPIVEGSEGTVIDGTSENNMSDTTSAGSADQFTSIDAVNDGFKDISVRE